MCTYKIYTLVYSTLPYMSFILNTNKTNSLASLYSPIAIIRNTNTHPYTLRKLTHFDRAILFVFPNETALRAGTNGTRGNHQHFFDIIEVVKNFQTNQHKDTRNVGGELFPLGVFILRCVEVRKLDHNFRDGNVSIKRHIIEISMTTS